MCASVRPPEFAFLARLRRLEIRDSAGRVCEGEHGIESGAEMEPFAVTRQFHRL